MWHFNLKGADMKKTTDRGLKLITELSDKWSFEAEAGEVFNTIPYYFKCTLQAVFIATLGLIMLAVPFLPLIHTLIVIGGAE